MAHQAAPSQTALGGTEKNEESNDKSYCCYLYPFIDQTNKKVFLFWEISTNCPPPL